MGIRDYKITDEQFNEKGMTSLPDTLKGTPYENKRSLEKFTREVVAPQFNAIVDAFADMEESTNNWSAEEAQRVQQENARQTAEQGRVSAEETRVQSEAARVSAESQRASAESARAEAETARANAESVRANNEISWQNTEHSRAEAEASRRASEEARSLAEDARNVWENYDVSKTYYPGNKVQYKGSSYVCLKISAGHTPPDAAFWQLIAAKGLDGTGFGDMLADIYDPNSKECDFYAYADEAAAASRIITDDSTSAKFVLGVEDGKLYIKEAT